MCKQKSGFNDLTVRIHVSKPFLLDMRQVSST